MLCCLVINLYFAVILNFLELNCESRVFNCIGCFLPHMLMSELSWEYRKIPHVSDACTCNILFGGCRLCNNSHFILFHKLNLKKESCVHVITTMTLTPDIVCH